MANSNTSSWEAPKFLFDMEDQASQRKKFYITAIDYLETLDIDPEQGSSWHELVLHRFFAGL